MAGMLPGVECARRRRFHGGAPPIDLSNTASVAAATGHVWTRRPSFSLYTTNHESHQAYVSFSFRQNDKDKVNKLEQGKGKSLKDLPTEVVGLKKSRRRLVKWFGWRVKEQQECAICLDQFKTGETLVHLPCTHKFHSICLLPWLDTNVYCPYCRMDIWN
ncbi:E3 ubiquitin protein ligase RIE1 isoform X2 [Raphanus sativus]|uniref:E3 ubiquitin protein ligase RIE1 isoform X2 n=1 Tax=Raphanus sativus TaxID=3726 RepID=A0A6J0LH51_RAPSA|nr:E3 ubiquitin protein ligase RIE1 isoform X2 [Raphanus sativus]